ncbi:MAG TPA: serine/threonine-protein kinase [Polyangiaceae bacterium]|nr:serine/threonine-protein kinase [Polyangiaceae bacterium]
MERDESVVVAARYQLLRKLGEGGMGSVWLAHDLSLDARCALKLIDHDKRSDPEVRLRFAREARAAAQVRSTHVVDVFDHGEWEGVPFIAMEYLVGEDLGERLERCGRLDADTTYRVVAQVARALTRAHAAGIVHRDLKPENVFLVREEEGELCKVLDFGIAKFDSYSLKDHATKSGSLLGTPCYVSPEQARGEPVDHRSDLWSLAVIAFHCLTGRLPFQSQGLGLLLAQVIYARLPLPSEIDPALPAALDAWWLRAASRDPEQRFQSARDLAEGLGSALGAAPLPSTPSSFPPPPVVRGGSLADPAPASRSRNALFGVSGLVLGAGLTFVVAALRSPPTESGPVAKALRAASIPPPAPTSTPLPSNEVAKAAPGAAPAIKKVVRAPRPKKQRKPARKPSP